MPRLAPPSHFEFNGLDALTGQPLLRISSEEAVQIARGDHIQPKYFKELRDHWERVQKRPFEVVHGIDPSKLEEAGWGVVWAHGLDPAIREALRDLVGLRQQQAGDLFRELIYRPGESTLDFLGRHKVGPGPVKPGTKRLPYYLLLVGSPEQIPFSVQYKLDVQHGVGRLWLEGAEAYAHYAEGVVRAEAGELRRPKKISLVGVSNPGDNATSLSRQELVEPLGTLADSFQDWSFDLHVGDDARKESLGQLLGGPRTPALLFFAGHGLGYPNGHPAQRDRQGALVCQDWAGPGGRGITKAESFAAADLSPSANPSGMIAFFFACFGAGTPLREDFHGEGETPEDLAPSPFVSKLPQRLLGNPGGTALAVIGHVERAWTYSFLWPNTGPQLQVFESTLGRLLDGYPVGAAMEYFGQRFAELAVYLQAAQADLRFEPDPDIISAIGTAFAFKDARSYIVLGDPAVRVAVDSLKALRGGTE